MQDRPSAPQLLEALASFLLAEVAPRLEANKALQFRVAIAANLAQVVGAELNTFDARLLGESIRLRALFPDHPAVERLDVGTRTERLAAVKELDRFLARALRKGAMKEDRRLAAGEHLWATARETLAISNPRFDLNDDL
jgi:Domain of unknown function (DUF6285)